MVELQFTNANTFGNAGTIGASAGATLTFGADPGSAIITNFGTINLTGGTLNSGTITNLASGFVGGMGTITSNLINGGILMATNGTLTLASTPVNNGTAIVASASALNVLTDWTNGGVLSNAATGAVNGGNLTNTGTINGSGFYNEQIVNQNRMNFGGAISNNFLQTAGSFTVISGGSTITGSGTINGGALDLTGNQLTAGQLVVANTGELSNSVLGATLNGGVSNAATVSFATDAYINGVSDEHRLLDPARRDQQQRGQLRYDVGIVQQHRGAHYGWCCQLRLPDVHECFRQRSRHQFRFILHERRNQQQLRADRRQPHAEQHVHDHRHRQCYRRKLRPQRQDLQQRAHGRQWRGRADQQRGQRDVQRRLEQRRHGVPPERDDV